MCIPKLFSYHFCILLPSHEWMRFLPAILFYFKICTFRILAYANILTPIILCSPRSLTDAVWVWEELGTSCEGCRLPWSQRCLVSTVESRPPFLQGFFRSVPIRNKCSWKNDFSRSLQSHADSDSDLSRTQHASDIQRYGVLFSHWWGQHEWKPFRLNRVDLKCS